ncbi:PREDICTED: uncharacterized protein LOC105563428 [Vollenhovia emeryi]|uniref:uncharacterized protein LOC105563428 n=1 Tax=Vollenhovia emeryi TaxID=411798 RepID=UPI0005F4FC31|nr:PREDICTED: uncharacterized protein LOC105563428 [Vollenhovia emeryi]
MRMKISWLPALIFCATLALVAANLDLGPIIKSALCQSMCLKRYVKDGGACKDDLFLEYGNCGKCRATCQVMESMLIAKKDRQYYTHISKYEIDEAVRTAATFFQRLEMDEEKYEPTKLLAPENSKSIHLNDYDVAVSLRKNTDGTWRRGGYYYAKQEHTAILASWIIVVAEDSTVKHYSWKNWKPTLQSLNADGPLYQAFITWQDWQIQLKNQEKTSSSTFSKNSIVIWTDYEIEQPSFVITWQQETGDGIMGNQVTDGDAAQISLPCNNRYLVRVASDDGPGSYPIVVDTGICENPETSIQTQIHEEQRLITITVMLSLILFVSLVLCLYLSCRKSGKESKTEAGCLMNAQKESMMGKLKKLLKKLAHQHLNVNANVKAQDVNASTPEVRVV